MWRSNPHPTPPHPWDLPTQTPPPAQGSPQGPQQCRLFHWKRQEEGRPDRAQNLPICRQEVAWLRWVSRLAFSLCRRARLLLAWPSSSSWCCSFHRVWFSTAWLCQRATLVELSSFLVELSSCSVRRSRCQLSSRPACRWWVLSPRMWLLAAWSRDACWSCREACKSGEKVGADEGLFSRILGCQVGDNSQFSSPDSPGGALASVALSRSWGSPALECCTGGSCPTASHSGEPQHG